MRICITSTTQYSTYTHLEWTRQTLPLHTLFHVHRGNVHNDIYSYDIPRNTLHIIHILSCIINVVITRVIQERRGEWFLNHLLICSHILHLNLQSCIYIYILDLMWPIMSLQDLIIQIFPISSCVFISSVGSIVILDLRSSSDQSRSNGLDLVKLNPS